MNRHRRWPKLLALVLAVVLLAGIGGYWYLRPLLRTGTGYAAHNHCAVTMLAGRSNPEADLPPNPLVPYLRFDAGQPGRSRATVLGVLAGQNAWETEFGCVVAANAPTLPAALVVPPAAEFPTQLDASLDSAVARAFGDDLDQAGRTALGTRAVIVVKGGTVVAERYADGFTADTVQLGWSMTKSVTNLLTGRLVRERGVSLTDDHLRPEWTDQRADITIDDLLRMTSGLAWDETYDLGTPITQMLYGEPDMAAFVAAQQGEHTPGDFQQYSTGSTNLLCSVLLAKADGDANLPRELLFEPLGLGSAVLESDAVGNPVCGSYLWATPRDWARIGQFALDDGVISGRRLLPEGWMAESTTPRAVAETDAAGMGASWWANRLPDGALVEPTLPADAYWASGHDGQKLVVVPSADLVVARLGFTPEVDDERAAQLVADVIAAG